MPVGGDDVVTATGLDPAFIDRSGDPLRKNPEFHNTEAPAYLHSEGKAGLQQTYLSDADDFPTAEELRTLRRVPAHIPLKIYTIAFVEFCERMSYYGTIAVYSNFIAKKRPTATGAALDPHSDQAAPGALGKGKQVAFSLTTFNAFWVYCTPLLGAWIADTYLGRFKTIVYSVLVAEIGHLILVASSAPKVLDKPESSLAAFILGLLIMGLGTGTFKPNISPLIAEQIPQERMRVETRGEEKVIVDPAVTATRIYNWFYFFINCGAVTGQVGMVYAERYVGFWLAYLIPTIFFLICLPVLFFCKKMYILRPPSGSVMGPAFGLLFKALGTGWSWNPVRTWKNWNDGTMWEKVKPSRLGDAKPKWYTFDDAWVDEVSRGFTACGVFFWVPIFWLAYRQMDNNLTQMCSTMSLHGVPNDLLNNLDPIAIIIIVPIMDILVYPALRKAGINFSPIKKITAGFIIGSFAMVWAAVLQHYIYKTTSPPYYGNEAYWAENDNEYVSPINVWAVSGVYVLIAISEIFASVTTLEYAYTKAPKNMRSLVQAVQLFTTAFSAALAQAFTPLTADPHLVWNYAAVAIIAFATGIFFHFAYRSTDKREDQLNTLPTGHVGTASQAQDVERRLSINAERRASTAAPAEKQVVG
ncbi:MFS peptide transporter-like protein Ptr2 [Lophiostoma macrostomum CBS 122681]|uniref:MFS peptide transporter-like protein Ptr2 n=1 Tax=Lophiostoma macrostomum CBS 122681 TaxID=1314788 RepID=A0A6A6TK57_9PLEO|nr:MFS peptide transporter-like protein Ptr2 [Lophiostoma macrostomum CBS 122681]